MIGRNLKANNSPTRESVFNEIKITIVCDSGIRHYFHFCVAATRSDVVVFNAEIHRLDRDRSVCIEEERASDLIVTRVPPLLYRAFDLEYPKIFRPRLHPVRSNAKCRYARINVFVLLPE